MDLARDVRLAARGLLRSPGYAAAAVVTLALSIGATSAIFSVVHAVLLRPLPIPDPDRLVVCWEKGASPEQGVAELSYRNVRDWSEGMRGFARLAGFGSSNWAKVLDSQSGEPARLWYAAVTASFFDTLGVPPLLGRALRPEDDVAHAAPVVVLNHGTWVRRFGGDPGIVGRTIRLDGAPHTVVGVMPRGFDFPKGAEFWAPVVPELVASADLWHTDALTNVGVLFAIARLKDGVEAGPAAQELEALARRLAEGEKAPPRFGASVVVTPFVAYLLGPARLALWCLFAAVGVLLLIACANVSGLLLTRVSLRRRESAIRLALGASRARLGRLWVLETLLVAVAGGGCGLLASSWMAAAVVRLGPDDLPRLSDVSIDLPVAAFTAVVVSLAALVCAAVPIRQAGSLDLADALHDGGRASAGRRALRARGALLTVQIGLAVALLVSAGLVLRSFANLRRIELGFSPANVLLMDIDPRQARPSGNEWFRLLIERVHALPGVEAAGAVHLRPLAFGRIGQGTWVRLEGQADTPEATKDNPILNYQVATPGYFEAMRISLVRGRGFSLEDDARAERVAIVGESTARRLWPGQDPIGKRMAMPGFSPDGPPSYWRTVVGVVRDVRYRGLDQVTLDVYDPSLQAATRASDLVVRTAGNPLGVVAAVQAQARDLDPGVVIDRVSTLDAIVARAQAPWQLGAWTLALFAGLAFLLAAVGLFSLVSLDVAHRGHEFAVRLALGAEGRDIVGGVLKASAGRVAAGVAIGVGLAFVAARGLESLLFEVTASDPRSYAAVAVAVVLLVGVASYLPARRASGADPLALLRRE